MKETLKKVVFSCSLLKNLFILLYKLRGRRPWSFGYSVFKYDLIRHYIRTNHYPSTPGKLPQHFGSGIDERIVEYPWLFSRLKSKHSVILDAGSSLNHYSVLTLDALKNRKLYISTLAYEGVYKNLANSPFYRYEDLRKMSYENNFFDVVVCISTLEHIGMDNHLYTGDAAKKENDQAAYLQAIGEFRRVLKENGSLFLTVPFGRYKNCRWFQIFDSKMIKSIIDYFQPTAYEAIFFKYANHQWQFANEQECQDAKFFDIHTDCRVKGSTQAASESIACLELIK